MIRYFSGLNIYYRLLLLILGTTSFFFILYFCLFFYSIRQEKAVHRSALREYNNEIHSIFELNSKTHLATLVDVTFWDELVDYTKTKNREWFLENIESQFPSYEVDYIGIYDLNYQLIHQSNSSQLKSIGKIPQQAFEQLYQNKVSHYYIKIPEGVLEVFGATIHPSNDPKKLKFKPAGFFFMARLLDQKFISNLEKITVSSISLMPLQEQAVNEKNEIAVTLPLKDWQKKVVGKINFEKAFLLNFNNTRTILEIIIVATIINLFIYLYYYRKWVNKPLTLIKNILETKSESSMTKLRNLRGDLGYIGRLLEVNNNQRKELEVAKQKAEEGDKLKSSFLANLSHEIRTPMNAIMGFADLLSMPEIDEQERAGYLKIIRESGKNLTSIIEDLLEMSKIDSRQLTPNYTALDLDKCLQELHQAIRITIPEKKELDFLIQNGKQKLDRKILTDETKLKQILINLITNAIKFTKKGKVSMGYELEGQSIRITVTDSGMGISKENIKVIFDRFRRVENDATIQLSGLGLGLSITKAYIEMLGGTIDVKSEIGKGSIFSFTLPLRYAEAAPLQPVAEKTAITHHAAGHTILIAEDNDINYMLLEKIIQFKNHQVLRANNGKEAVEICQENSAIDLVFMDIKMPIMDGFEAFALIKKFRPSLPIVANTAYSSTEDREKIMTTGFTSYISKPLNKEQIFDLLDTLFEKK